MALDWRLDQVLLQRNGHEVRRRHARVGTVPSQRRVHLHWGGSHLGLQDTLGVLV